jgi:DNA-binding CsgD family transcriptional regulator
LDYEISVVGPEFGALLRLFSSGECVPIAGGRSHCYSLLYGQQQPCDDCPVLRMASAPWPRILVRPSTDKTATERPTFEVVTAEALSATHVRVKVRNICGNTLDAIQQAKVERLAVQAHLSPREREVLGYLLLGRSIEDMAKLVGISPRTVKHHQASVLEKLGADSRADLMRLIF